MLTVLRDMGMPPMMLGMMRQMAKGIKEQAFKDMCGRVGFGMLAVYTGSSPRDAMKMEALTSGEMDELLSKLTDIRDEALEAAPETLELEEGDDGDVAEMEDAALTDEESASMGETD